MDYSVTVDSLTWRTPNRDLASSPRFIIREMECWLQFHKGRCGSDYLLNFSCNDDPDEPLDLSVLVVVGKDTVSSSRTTYTSGRSVIWKGYFAEISKVVPNFDQRELLFKVTVHDNAATGEKPVITGEKSIQADLNLIQPNLDLDHLSSDLSSLLDNEVNPDVRLNCKDGVIHAHQLILSARSKVFATMFQTDMAEKKTGEVNLHHLNLQTARLFLKFVYSGKIPDFAGEMAPTLYFLADKYEVLSLKKMCSDFMAKNVSGENYSEYLVLADTHGDENFKRSIVVFIISNPEMMRNENWRKFSAEHMKLALEVLQAHVDNSDL